jgi:two-component system, OmpR family, response regulator
MDILATMNAEGGSMGKSQAKVRMFSALEVANLCGVVNQTAINWIRNGYLKAFVTPGGQFRIYTEDLLEFLKERAMKIPPELASGIKSEVDWLSVAIVDDDKSLNDIVKRYLEKSHPNFTILQAFDGFEAGALLADKKPGFIILDIDLPGLDGNQICYRIKNDPGFGKPFVVTMTGLDSPVIKERALAAGADAFIPKPLDFTLLVSIVAELAAKVR